MDPFPDEWRWLSYFECEPTLLDPGAPWAYNHLTFATQRGLDVVRCQIEPAYETLRVLWNRNNVQVMNVDLHWVRGIEIETGNGQEVLRAHFRDPHLAQFVLRLKPHVSVTWGTHPSHP